MKQNCANARPGHGLLVLSATILFFLVIAGTFFWSLGAA